jgi:hypothetical protein
MCTEPRRGSPWRQVLLLAALLLPAVGGAASIETLLMPGKVTRAHAKVEAQCSECHDRADKGNQDRLCMSCHEPVAADIKASTGFHGRRAAAGRTACSACHTEHLGRDADIVKLRPAAFDHAQTDFKLEGAHAGAPCAGCHASGKAWREAPTACVDCHRKVEPHEGRLGKACADCHVTRNWQQVRFDHDKTRFALADRHADVPCASCHAGNRWQDTPRQCVSCHAVDDVHRTRRGIACADCHTTAGWDQARFDHGRETGFALQGAHAKAACQSCHRTGRYEDKLPKDCNGCHKATDVHGGRFGPQCDSCHGNEAWQPARFDHERDGKFKLEGPHAKLDCHACHAAPVSRGKLGTQCQSCHRDDDVHGGVLGTECLSCHEPQAWRPATGFDHDLTQYPLVGQHVVVACGQCHVTPRFEARTQDCVGCHERDDVHRGNLGRECARCHTPNGWNQWEFDHSRETGFALTGAHGKASCGDCHRRPAGTVKLGKDCASCHADDDVHLGQYGRQCARCHSTVSFRTVKPQ